ncbi:phosphate-binding protein PstS [Nitrospirota bacterium]|nr:phosphate-binding protein PstS [Nitrospirota bacterium]GDX89851.1 phosphate-binding protein PstS [Nitrospirota bacterium]
MNVQDRPRTILTPSVLATGLIVALLSGIGSTAGAEQVERIVRVANVTTEAPYQPMTAVEGRLSIAGSDTMRPLLVKLAADFSRNHSKAKVAVEGGGSSQGLREFVLGLSGQRRGDKARGTGTEGASSVTVFASSRALNEQESGHFTSRFGYEPLAIPIAMDAVAIYVHASNPIPRLSLEQLASIYGTGAAAPLATWGQLGLGERWSQAPIDVYGRDNRSGTKTFFSELVLQGKPQKPTVLEEPGSASEVLAIARNPFAIGYAGIGFTISDIRVVPLAKTENDPAVPPTAESVTTGAYPLSRPLYLYINSDPTSAMHPVLLEFLRYVNSAQGQAVVLAAKAYPLPQTTLETNQTLLTRVPQ